MLVSSAIDIISAKRILTPYSTNYLNYRFSWCKKYCFKSLVFVFFLNPRTDRRVNASEMQTPSCRARRRSVFDPPRSPLDGQRTDAPRDPSSRRRGRAALRPIDAARTVRVALRAASHEPRARRAITRRRRLPKCREEVSENRNF